MSPGLRFVLIADGSSDRVLIHPLRWLLGALGHSPVDGQPLDFEFVDPKPETLTKKASLAAQEDCDLIFVHRDAEGLAYGARIREIRDAVPSIASPPVVCVVPVRMTEAWLLIDEQALRAAANNPRGRVRLDMPRLKSLESIGDPKERLHGLLRRASELTGRRAAKFRISEVKHRLAELIEDYSPLRSLPAFQALEAELRQALEEFGNSRRARGVQQP
jgi:hypothetical protein